MNDQELLTSLFVSGFGGAVVAGIGIGIAKSVRRVYWAAATGVLVGTLAGVAFAALTHSTPVVVASIFAVLGGLASMIVATTRSVFFVVVSGLIFGSLLGGLAGAIGGILAGLLVSSLHHTKRSPEEACQDQGHIKAA